MLPRIVNELTKSQIDQINKVSQTGGKLSLKTNKKTSRRRIFGGTCFNWNTNGYQFSIENVWWWPSSG